MNIACKDCVKWNKGCMGEEDYINPHECSYGYEDVSLLSNRIADALKKIARELERGNKLKALELEEGPTDYNLSNCKIREIMED